MRCISRISTKLNSRKQLDRQDSNLDVHAPTQILNGSSNSNFRHSSFSNVNGNSTIHYHYYNRDGDGSERPSLEQAPVIEVLSVPGSQNQAEAVQEHPHRDNHSPDQSLNGQEDSETLEPSYPFYTPPSPFFLPLPDTPDPFYRRRHSFSLYPQSAIRTWDPYYPPFLNPPVSPAQLHIHPWLNAQTWNGEFLFNLADRRFNPMRRHVAGIMRTTSPSGMDILCQAATYPPLNRLRIICDIIPQWSIDLRHRLDMMPDGSGMSFDTTRTSALDLETSPVNRLLLLLLPPITLLDILIQVHRSLHTRITRVDWAKLTSEEEAAVSKAYRKRCNAAGSTSTIGSREAVQAELVQGVKRVDFLLERIWFKGCVMDLERGIMRLIVGKKS
ncbi:hypothetical protein VKT23_011473 [Stygiomarasmius scandens]|uniref:DUF6699 domain-containing protein n=1 Tax=Marasmiellus scandens TaxID=2682957 RepID=A0ABR1J947_9AGAR